MTASPASRIRPAGAPTGGSGAPRGPRLLVMLLAALTLVLLLPTAVLAQAFPFYDHEQDFLNDPQRRETWILYPFYSSEQTSGTLTRSLRPLYSWHEDIPTGNKDIDFLWPVFSHRYRPQTQAAKDRRSTYLFPLFYQRREERFGKDIFDRVILPIWFEGSQTNRGRYQILFPFFWYAYNAKMITPLFPPREQTFAAIFPLAGDFRGYWNRDRIRFILWPLFVHSSEGTGQDYNQVHSILWPILGLYSGPKTSGFRVWPLFAWVEKEGEYKRCYWLWPLGHYRQGRIGKTNDGQQDVTLFIPFYARFRQPNVKLDMVFPFYGKLQVGDRVSKGYALALYNTDTNTRKGIREQRYLLFLIRRKTPLPGFDPATIPPDVTLGGGVFPFYTRTHNATKVSKNIVWPIHQYRYNQYQEFSYTRSYILPLYANRLRVYTNGRTVHSKFLFPFFRTKKTTKDDTRTNALHLFFYSDVESIDRLYAPLWSWWEKSENPRTGAKSLRWFRNAWLYERSPTGTERKKINLLFYKYEKNTESDGTSSGRSQVLFGLVRHSF